MSARESRDANLARNDELALAAREGDIERLSLLLNTGADAYGGYGDSSGRARTPLHDAAAAGQLHAVELLVQKGANVNLRDLRTGETPLFCCVRNYGRHEKADQVVSTLVRAHASPVVPDAKGVTPLQLALGDAALHSFLEKRPEDARNHGSTSKHAAAGGGLTKTPLPPRAAALEPVARTRAAALAAAPVPPGGDYSVIERAVARCEAGDGARTAELLAPSLAPEAERAQTGGAAAARAAEASRAAHVAARSQPAPPPPGDLSVRARLSAQAAACAPVEGVERPSSTLGGGDDDDFQADMQAALWAACRGAPPPPPPPPPAAAVGPPLRPACHSATWAPRKTAALANGASPSPPRPRVPATSAGVSPTTVSDPAAADGSVFRPLERGAGAGAQWHAPPAAVAACLLGVHQPQQQQQQQRPVVKLVAQDQAAQLQELTGVPREVAYRVLKACHFDLNAAANRLFDGDDGSGGCGAGAGAGAGGGSGAYLGGGPGGGEEYEDDDVPGCVGDADGAAGRHGASPATGAGGRWLWVADEPAAALPPTPPPRTAQGAHAPSKLEPFSLRTPQPLPQPLPQPQPQPFAAGGGGVRRDAAMAGPSADAQRARLSSPPPPPPTAALAARQCSSAPAAPTAKSARKMPMSRWAPPQRAAQRQQQRRETYSTPVGGSGLVDIACDGVSSDELHGQHGDSGGLTMEDDAAAADAEEDDEPVALAMAAVAAAEQQSQQQHAARAARKGSSGLGSWPTREQRPQPSLPRPPLPAARTAGAAHCYIDETGTPHWADQHGGVAHAHALADGLGMPAALLGEYCGEYYEEYAADDSDEDEMPSLIPLHEDEDEQPGAGGLARAAAAASAHLAFGL